MDLSLFISSGFNYWLSLFILHVVEIYWLIYIVRKVCNFDED